MELQLDMVSLLLVCGHLTDARDLLSLRATCVFLREALGNIVWIPFIENEFGMRCEPGSFDQDAKLKSHREYMIERCKYPSVLLFGAQPLASGDAASVETAKHNLQSWTTAGLERLFVELFQDLQAGNAWGRHMLGYVRNLSEWQAVPTKRIELERNEALGLRAKYEDLQRKSTLFEVEGLKVNKGHQLYDRCALDFFHGVPPDRQAVSFFHKVVVSRAGNYTCPIRCGVLLAGLEAPKPGLPQDQCVERLKALASEQMCVAVNDMTDVAQVLEASSTGRLPPIIAHVKVESGEWVEFARPEGSQTAAMQLTLFPIVWFRFLTRNELPPVPEEDLLDAQLEDGGEFMDNSEGEEEEGAEDLEWEEGSEGEGTGGSNGYDGMSTSDGSEEDADGPAGPADVDAAMADLMQRQAEADEEQQASCLAAGMPSGPAAAGPSQGTTAGAASAGPSSWDLELMDDSLEAPPTEAMEPPQALPGTATLALEARMQQLPPQEGAAGEAAQGGCMSTPPQEPRGLPQETAGGSVALVIGSTAGTGGAGMAPALGAPQEAADTVQPWGLPGAPGMTMAQGGAQEAGSAGPSSSVAAMVMTQGPAQEVASGSSSDFPPAAAGPSSQPHPDPLLSGPPWVPSTSGRISVGRSRHSAAPAMAQSPSPLPEVVTILPPPDSSISLSGPRSRALANHELQIPLQQARCANMVCVKLIDQENNMDDAEDLHPYPNIDCAYVGLIGMAATFPAEMRLSSVLNILKEPM